eukprot:GILK01005254.1.p1 GENE.GILK01005254.1~~GILK01005254.1.p1  ORF type:complete len:162 (+),score=16.41 GILK01005254.1:37-522(+)
MADEEDDLDALLNDLLSVDVQEASLSPLSKRPPVESLSPVARDSGAFPVGAGGEKCFKASLGGSEFSVGLSLSSRDKKVCDRLRCTSCDFRVTCFSNYKWADDCDYMFFRNVYPDSKQLAKKLTREIGSSAYACQCSWRNATELLPIVTDPSLKWVCSGHI